MTRRRMLAILVGSLLVATGSGAAVGASSGLVLDSGSGVGDPYYPLDGNAGYDVRKYVIRDRVPISSGRLTGSTTLHAVAQEELTSFHLDLLLDAEHVVVNGVAAGFTKPDPHELRVEPEQPLPAGEPFTVRVWYAGEPAGLSYVTGASWGYERDPIEPSRSEVLAVNEPHIAPYWFAANDHPTDKARFDIRITVPSGRQAVANGVLVSKEKGAHWTTWRWVPRDPMATYLAFFAAGRLQLVQGSVEGTPHVFAVSRRLTPPNQMRALEYLQRTPFILRWLEKRLGPYPFETVGGVVTSISTGFALENQTRPVYPVSALPYRELITHELAHQWFGNLVSVEEWNDIWINEGFAQYMEQLWLRGVNSWLELTYGANGPTAGLWDVQLSDPGGDVHELFAPEVYERGAMTLAALRRVIGTEDFWLLMRTWLADNAHGNASVEDFRELAETVSGEDLGQFFVEWLDDKDRPPNDAAIGLGF